jgi:predicted membrane-bound dolichyl-phosphate-mannose-protein mannosyltransferase
MQTTKPSFSLHVLTILPTIIFIFTYLKLSIFSVGAISILLVLLAISTFKHLKKQDLPNYSLVLLLMLSFYLYVFNNLGNTNTPKSFTTLSERNSVSKFNFDGSTNIDKMCYFIGIDSNVNFTLEKVENGIWKKFYSYEKNYPFSFRWKCIKKKLSTTSVLLRVTKNKMMLHEVRFFHKGTLLPYTSKNQYLNDEPKTDLDTSYYSSMFFDEIYFGRTAFEIMRDQPIYENSHPYLGKLLMIPGIKTFGMTPFGWRFMNALFAGLLVFMAYFFALHLFRKHRYAFGAAFLMTYSFMHLAQARIGLIDTFGVFFVFVSYFYLYRFIVAQQLSRLITSGVFFGLAAAVKWSAIFASLGFVFIAFYLLLSRYPLEKRYAGYKLLLYGILSYGVVAFLVYVISFWDIYAHTGSLTSIYNYNTNMYNYHSTLQATHPYSSSWWQWPLNIQPMGYFKKIKDGLLSSINAFGNPAIFWMGIVALFYLIISAVKKHSLEAVFILFAFLGLYLPYIFVGRLMFIYHFYYAVPFLILSIIYMFKDVESRFDSLRFVYIFYLGLVATLFLAFYPILSGYKVPKAYVYDWLTWFSQWWF